jgi:hypothetical protein
MRVMNSQSTVRDVVPLVALIQSLARLELEGESTPAVPGPELLAENRSLAARERAFVAVEGRLDHLAAKLAQRFLAPAGLAPSGLTV